MTPAPGHTVGGFADRCYSSSMDAETRTLYVSGSVVEPLVGTFDDDVRNAISAGGARTLDLTHVDFLPAAATRALAGADVDVRVAADSVPHRVLGICGLPHRPW